MMSFKTKKIKSLLFFLFVFLFSLIISFRLHSGKKLYTWESEIWADRAGYYMYLPATFFYHFDASKFPKDIDIRTGLGFNIDPKRNAVVTQYYYGEALLLSPFFLQAHFIQQAFHMNEEGGFSGFYIQAMNLAAIIYLLLGLYFLGKFLEKYFPSASVLLTLVTIFLGTNLFFYTVEDSLMSHVYSFFGASLFLFAMKSFLDDQKKYKYFLLMIVTFSLIVIIRPTNALLGFCFFFWDLKSKRNFLERIRMMIIPRYIFPFIFVLVLFCLPQLIYWEYAHGSYIYPKYAIEFSNWHQPRFAAVWFSTLNGLFIYSPLVMVFVIGALWMSLRKNTNGMFVLVMFLTVSYVAASLKCWYYGCGFGHRAFIEYYPLLGFPVAFLSDRLLINTTKSIKIPVGIGIIFFFFLNIALTVSGDKCNEGSVWDWDQFSREMYKTGLIPVSLKSDNYTNDFENQQICGGFDTTRLVFHSRDYSVRVKPGEKGFSLYSIYLRDLKKKEALHLQVSFWVYGSGQDSTALSAEMKDKNKVLFTKEYYPVRMKPDPENWQIIQQEIQIPFISGRDTFFEIVLLNKVSAAFYIDDVKVRFR
ncbi:MAG: hypothetical protein Q8867_09675 [Bacteroidota bacterium]|nr:hypothetical protein [Bacteroidota bacterium]